MLMPASREYVFVQPKPSMTEKADPKNRDWTVLGWRDRALVLVAPLLLFGVAINHQVLTATQNLDPWKGGGFGMFSTVDSRSTRQIFVFGVMKDGQLIGERNAFGIFDLNQVDLSRRVKVMPDDKTLLSLAKDAFEELRATNESNLEIEDLVALRFEVVTLEFDSRSRQVFTKILKTFEVPAP